MLAVPGLNARFTQTITLAMVVLLVFAIGPRTAYAQGQTTGTERVHSRRDTTSADGRTRAEQWREKRRRKAQHMSSPEPSFGDRVRQFVAETGGTVLPHRLILQVPNLEVAGVHPVLGGLGGNAGLAAGLLYEPPGLTGNNQFANVEALASVRRYYRVESVAGMEWERYVAYGFGRYQHRPREKFYGVGPELEADKGAQYRLDRALLGGLFGRYFGDRILIGGHGSYQLNRFGNGRGNLPQMSEQFPALAGVDTDADYLVIGTFLEYDGRDTSSDPSFGRRFAPTKQRLRSVSLEATRGLYVAAEVTQNLDTRRRQFDFTRFTLDVREFLPIDQGLMHGFAFRQFVSLTKSPEGQVPFYRLQSVGGSRSLRGYRTNQFIDRNALVSNVEVRCQVWHWLDMALFTDVGQVFNRIPDAQLDDPYVGYGIGFRLKKDGQTLARLDVARSENGITTHLDLGSLF